MAFRVKSGNIVIEADTKQELKEVLDLLGALPNEAKGHEESDEEDEEQDRAPAQTKSKSPLSSPPDELTYRIRLTRFMKVISNSRQEELIHLLLQAFPEGFSDDAIRYRLNLDSNRELGPIFTAITKNANKCSLPTVVGKHLIDDGESKYAYFLTEDVGKRLKQLEKRREEEQKQSEPHSGSPFDDIPF